MSYFINTKKHQGEIINKTSNKANKKYFALDFCDKYIFFRRWILTNNRRQRRTKVKLPRNDLIGVNPDNITIERNETMMSLNESPLNPFELIWPGIITRLKTIEINRYYNNITGKLNNSLCNYLGYNIQPENLLLTNGADEALFYLFTGIRTERRDKIVTLHPSYFDYVTYSRAVGLDAALVQLNPDFSMDSQLLIQTANEDNSRMIIICNPNNPTGNLFSDKKIIKIIENTDKLVLIDEAYYEFSQKTLLPLIHKYDNLCIIRTFSKGFSSAGLRFGYLITNSDLIHDLKKIKTAFNLSLVTQAIAYEILKHKKLFIEFNYKLTAMRDQIFREMEEIEHIHPCGSTTNFITFKVDGDHRQVLNYLGRQGISIRDLSYNRVLKNCLRMTVSSAEDNNSFINHLKSSVQTDA